MSIQQETDSFCSCNYRASAGALHQFGDRWSKNVFPTRNLIALFHHWSQLDIDRMVWIDVGSIDMVSNDAAITRVNTGYHGRGVHHCGTGINRMMIPKSDTLPRELPKSRTILLAHKIWTHPVPHNHHYMLPWFGRHDC